MGAGPAAQSARADSGVKAQDLKEQSASEFQLIDLAVENAFKLHTAPGDMKKQQPQVGRYQAAATPSAAPGQIVSRAEKSCLHPDNLLTRLQQTFDQGWGVTHKFILQQPG